MPRQVDEDFARYVRARQHGLLRAAYLVCGDERLAEELLQQAFVKVALRWDRLRAEDPDAHVRRVLYRDAVLARRRTRREPLVELLPQARPQPTVREARRSGDRVDVRLVLAALTPRQRAVVVLRFFEHRSEADTAEVLGIPVGTVAGQVEAALARIRELVPDLAASSAGSDEP